jgi:hypothetical protein
MESSVSALRVVTVLLCLLTLPAIIVLAGVARGYLDTTADIASVRVEVAEIRPLADPGRALAGPDIVLRVSGVAQSDLRFAEVNLDLYWQGRRVISASAFPNASIPRGGSLVVTVPSNLEPANADETRALIQAGERGFQVEGNARVGLPNSEVSVWLSLRGQVRAAVPLDPARWVLSSGPRVDRLQSLVTGRWFSDVGAADA